MKNVKRVYNATRDQWVKIICKDEPNGRISDDANYSRTVLGAKEGWFVATIYTHPEGIQELVSRDSDYFPTQDGASSHLREMAPLNKEENKKPMQVLEEMFKSMVRDPAPKEPDKEHDNERGR